jgi:hypothetical protein
MDEELERVYKRCRIRADYFAHLFSRHDRVVCAEPCGAGKTLGVAEFIAQNHAGGVLYAAQRRESLDKMEALLLKLGVERRHVSKYYAGSGADSPGDVYSRRRPPALVALVAHARLENDPMSYWTEVQRPSGQRTRTFPREFAIIDEPVNVSRIMRIEKLCLDALISHLTGRVVDSEHPVEIDPEYLSTYDYAANRGHIAMRYKDPFANFHISVINSSYIGAGVETTKDILAFDPTRINEIRRTILYDRIMLAYMGRCYKVVQDNANQVVEAVVFTSTEVLLESVCEKTLVLDATGALTPQLHHPIKAFVRSLDWPGSIGTLTIVEGSFTKGAERDFIKGRDPLLRVIAHLKTVVHEPALVFTWSSIEADVAVEVSDKPGWKVLHYGGTRGSNEYTSYRSVIFLGAFYRTPDYYVSFSRLFGDAPIKRLPLQQMSADILQEGYRSAIRNGETVSWYVATDMGSSLALVAELSRLGTRCDHVRFLPRSPMIQARRWSGGRSPNTRSGSLCNGTTSRWTLANSSRYC